MVGDDAQSIYSFRGAHFANILEFEKRYPDARRFHLTVNYRSTPEILHAGQRLHREQLQAVPEGAAQRPARRARCPALVPCRDVEQQAAFVAQRVLELRDEGIPLPEIAVLYRAHHHSMEIQFELARRGIPFVVRSGVRFFEAAHIKDVLAHLRFAHNPGDELALKRVLKLFPGIGSMTADAVWNALAARRRGGAGSVDELSSPDVASHVPPKAREGYRRAAELLRALTRAPTRDLPGESIDRVLEGGYEEYLRTAFLNADSRIEDIRQLADYARGYEDGETFLAEIALLTELTAETVAEGEEPDEKMVLSSVHQAKGLEWRAVFVVWLADGRFPSAQALRDPEGEEEERRLFYVACTRARDELTLCHPLVAAPRDRERVVLKASRFLEELPGEPAVYERWQLDDGRGLPALGPAPGRPCRAPGHGHAAPVRGGDRRGTPAGMTSRSRSSPAQDRATFRGDASLPEPGQAHPRHRPRDHQHLRGPRPEPHPAGRADRQGQPHPAERRRARRAAATSWWAARPRTSSSPTRATPSTGPSGSSAASSTPGWSRTSGRTTPTTSSRGRRARRRSRWATGSTACPRSRGWCWPT